MNSNLTHRLKIASLAFLAFAGCYAAPKKVSQLQPSPTTNPAKLAKDYWENTKPDLLPNHGKVAIEEFSVEYVSVSGAQPFERQPLFMPPPIDPIGLAITGSLAVSGVGRQSETYEAATMQRITAELYNDFRKNLEDRGLTVVAPAEVNATRAYAKLKTQDKANSSPLRYLQRSFSSDVGRVESSVTVPAPGLRVVVSDWGRDDTDKKMLEELNASVAASVHLRIVAYRGAAALMQGSTIRIVHRKDGSTTLKSKASLISDNMIVEGGKWEPGAGKKANIDAMMLSTAVHASWPTYLDLAFGQRQVNHFPDPKY